MSDTFDVIVVGAGGSGLAAALAVTELSGRVLILEKQPQPGGTTALAIGSFTAADTQLQRNAGIQDDPLAHAEDAGLFAPSEIEARNHTRLRRFFLGETANTLEWLTACGLSFVGPHPEPPNRVARMHNVVPGGQAYIAALQRAVQRAGATLHCNAAVNSLIRDGDRIVGVRALLAGQETEFRARRGVILAAGDYSSSPQQIAAHKGHEYQGIEGINPHAEGDGHRLAGDAGAELLNMDVTYGPELRFVPSSRQGVRSWLPNRGPAARLLAAIAPWVPRWITQTVVKRLVVTWQHPESELFDDGAILVNQEGKRFVNEVSSPAREIAVAQQKDKQAYILLDGQLVTRYSSWPNFVSTAPDIAYAYVSDYQRLRRDITTTGYTVEDVALRSGLDPKQLQHTVEEYNDYVAGKQIDPYDRCTDGHQLMSDPWVLLGPLKAYFTTTEGGAAVNEQLQVLDHNGEVIPGLYAVGQNGLGGMILWGHGLHVAWALTSGRLAGAAVMQQDPLGE